jgi:hypothetical protein
MFCVRTMIASVTALSLLSAGLVTADKQPAKRPHYRTGEPAIERALSAPVSLAFKDAPLGTVVDFLKEQCDIEIALDTSALADLNIEARTPVAVDLPSLPLRSALTVLLRPLKLVWTIKDDVLLITSSDEEESILTTKAIDVSDLVVCRGAHDELWDDYTTLIDMITSTITPQTWDSVGGPGSIEGATLGKAKVLVVLQTYHVHRQITDLLEQIREVAKKTPDREPPRRSTSIPQHRQAPPMGQPFGVAPTPDAGPLKPASGPGTLPPKQNTPSSSTPPPTPGGK